MARKRSLLYRNWGYLVLAIAIVLLAFREADPLVVSGAFALSGCWFLLAVPTWCGAKNRGEGYCRNNSYGLLGGCRQFRQHKWQRFKMLVGIGRFQDTFRGWFTGAPQQVATCGLIVSTVGVAAGLFA